jgi:hypothetical protein
MQDAYEIVRYCLTEPYNFVGVLIKCVHFFSSSTWHASLLTATLNLGNANRRAMWDKMIDGLAQLQQCRPMYRLFALLFYIVQPPLCLKVPGPE